MSIQADVATDGEFLNEFVALKKQLIESKISAQHSDRQYQIIAAEKEQLERKIAALENQIDLFSRQRANTVERQIDVDLELDLHNRHHSVRSSDYYFSIDVVGACSVKCPSCPVGNAETAMPKGLMSVETFTDILEKISREHKGEKVAIELYNWGESVLHPDLPKLIRITKGFGFLCVMSNNLNQVRDMRAVVKAEPDVMRCSISGFTNDIYQQTHAGGDVNMVKSNLFLLRSLLDKYDSDITVEVAHLVYRHNFQEDFDQIRLLCNELKFSFNWTFAVMMPIEKAIQCVEGEVPPSVKKINDMLVTAPKKYAELSKRYRTEYPDCPQWLDRTIINWDGSVPLCCGVYDYEYNIAENFLEASRADLDKRRRQHDLCTRCMDTMVDFMFSCNAPEEVRNYAENELEELGGNFAGYKIAGFATHG